MNYQIVSCGITSLTITDESGSPLKNGSSLLKRLNRQGGAIQIQTDIDQPTLALPVFHVLADYANGQVSSPPIQVVLGCADVSQIWTAFNELNTEPLVHKGSQDTLFSVVIPSS